MRGGEKPGLLVLTSTFPASSRDPSPRFVLDLSVRLTDTFEVTVIAPHGPGLEPRTRLENVAIQRFRYLPGRLETLTGRGSIVDNLRTNRWQYFAVPAFVLGQLIATVRVLRTRPISVIHAHWWIPQGLVAIAAARIARRRVPVVCTLHGADVYAFSGRPFRRLMISVLHRCRWIFPVSTAIKAALPGEVRDLARVVIAPMGVDMDVFRPKHGARPDFNRVVFVGRLAPKKGVSWLLEAFSLALREHAELRLTIVGSGPLREDMELLVLEFGLGTAVEFVGAMEHDRLPELYSGAGMAAVPSVEAPGGDREGLGLTAIEALACGCPVITSDTPSLNDIVTDDYNGLRVPQHDVNALANAIVRLAADRDLNSRLKAVARDSVRHFSWTNSTRLYRQLLSDAIRSTTITTDA